MTLISVLGRQRQRQADLREFQACLVYILRLTKKKKAKVAVKVCLLPR